MAKKKPLYQLGMPLDKAFEGMSKKEIQDNLEAGCYGKEEGAYTKNLTEAELGVAKSKFADVGIKIAKIKDDKKEAMDEFKTLLKEPEIESKNLLEMIKTKSIRKEGVLFLMDDPETNTMYSFDEEGVCVDFRPMLQSEKQQVLRQLKRVADGEV